MPHDMQTGGILLLTAAVNTVSDMPNNQRSASDLRQADYLEALDYYIDALPASVTNIVFCENTGADMAPFEDRVARAAAAGRHLHLLPFIAKTPAKLGKGICELEILDTAHQWMQTRFSPETPVWKVTGRLIVKNIADMIASRPSGAGLYVDMRSVPLIGESLGGNDWVEMRLMSYTIAAYDALLKERGPEFGYATEKGLFGHLIELNRAQNNIVPRFRTQPRFRGICGGSNKDYESMPYRLKDTIRILTRTVAPGLWL